MADQRSYDVLIHFQGSPIGKGFARRLWEALRDKGFHTFIYKDKFYTTGGEYVHEDVDTARVAIVIFSKNFTAESVDEELPDFLDIFTQKSVDNEVPDCHFIYPVFYDTNPSHVKTTAEERDWTQCDDHYEIELLHRWQAAVHKVADLPGWYFKHGDGSESEFIGNIVEDVYKMFDGVPSLRAEILDVAPEVSQTPQSDPDVSLTAADDVDQVLIPNSLNVVHEVDQVSLVFQETKIWRVVGLISGFAGLLCYALSPSFKPLIRGWKPFSVIVYVMLCLVILAIMWFAKQASPSTRQSRRNHLPSELKKAFTTCAVVIIISVYSLVYDKAVNGKPDILSVISNVAFAMVSLSLRKLTNSGFEFGVFCYFFGCFTIQLLLINGLLIFVAIIIGFLLFYMRSPLFSQPEAEGVESSREHNV